jgi:hypothetical protein
LLKFVYLAEKKWRKQQPTLGAADDLDLFEEIQVEMAATDGGGAHRTRLIISRHDASATFWYLIRFIDIFAPFF